MNQVPPFQQLPGELHLHVEDPAGLQPPDSPTDSDYFSSFEEDSLREIFEDDIVVPSDDWIELDLSAESAQSLSFLSGKYKLPTKDLTSIQLCSIAIDSDFQAVLKSFAEFTCQQFNNAVLNLREIQGALTNHLAFLLWRRAVMVELTQRPFHSKLSHITKLSRLIMKRYNLNLVEPELLDELFTRKWQEDSAMMHFNRQRFRNLADATTVPQLVLATFKTCFVRKRHAEKLTSDDELSKRSRRNLS